MDAKPSVAVVSSADLAGGAARSAHRLYRGLRTIDHPARMRVLAKRDPDPDVIAHERGESAAARAARVLEAHARSWWFARVQAPGRPSGHEMFSPDPWPPGRAALRGLEEFDALNLHWVAGYFDSRALAALCGARRPVVLTLHDMNMFTGGCHYDESCGRFAAACGACPQLGARAAGDLSARILARKVAAFARADPARLRVVAPSRWLAQEAGRSAALGRFQIDTIPYGLDLSVYAPGDKARARAALGVPHDARVVLFVAHRVDNARKGMARVLDALRLLADLPDLVLLGVGEGAAIDAPVRHVALGAIGDETRMALAYRAADAFAIASAQDNLPNTVLEALACGTPVVGTRVGGIPDMVRDGRTGYVAPLGDAAAFAAALRAILTDGDLAARLGRQARAVAEAEYALDIQARAYAAVFAELVKQ
ncbi:MAG: glycosyltransferase [Tagaea sp.]|nr:glycosyltransferase [Tagaea sp.]